MLSVTENQSFKRKQPGLCKYLESNLQLVGDHVKCDRKPKFQQNPELW
jgi:hypothetical protein